MLLEFLLETGTTTGPEADPTLLGEALRWAPSFVALCAVIAIANAVKSAFFKKFGQASARRNIYLQATTLGLLVIGSVAVVALLPIETNDRSQLVTVLGIIITSVIGLSSATFVGNAMAGLMLRMVGNYKPGDFVRVGDTFGRVTEVGLLHTEIQTPERDLTTLPNMFLVTNAVTVARGSGTVVYCEVSLGYDVPRQKIKEALLKAATDCGLDDPFVYVMNLGDYSVTYRISGLLTDLKILISARSKLRELVLDCLHGAGIEIVSPTFMNQRVHPAEAQFVPPKYREGKAKLESPDDYPDAKIFDKAEEASSKIELIEALKRIEERMHDLKAKSNSNDSERQIEQALKRMETLEAHRTKLHARLEAIEKDLKASK